eukprot:2535851-Amphidinium_carterae.1
MDNKKKGAGKGGKAKKSASAGIQREASSDALLADTASVAGSCLDLASNVTTQQDSGIQGKDDSVS